ncbi:MAG: protein phosphatase 2C domain-containing protein [Polyangiaceae bacterium]|nr:protein phosphatase 2C domain-containing protein [Polyangiaceae bacterium]
MTLDGYLFLILGFLVLLGLATWALSRSRAPITEGEGDGPVPGDGAAGGPYRGEPHLVEAPADEADGPRRGELRTGGASPRTVEFAAVQHRGGEEASTLRAVVLPDARCFFVVQALTGHPAPGPAVATAAEAIRSRLDRAARRGPLSQDDLREALLEANGRLRAEHPGGGDRAPGATALVALVTEDRVHVAHVGADRAFRLRGGELEALTEDHSMLNDFLGRHPEFPPEKVRDVKETFPPQYREVIVRALGMNDEVAPELTSHEWSPGEIVAIATKGVGDAFDQSTMPDDIGATRDPGELARRLAVAAAERRPGGDHAAIALRLGGA